MSTEDKQTYNFFPPPSPSCFPFSRSRKRSDSHQSSHLCCCVRFLLHTFGNYFLLLLKIHDRWVLDRDVREYYSKSLRTIGGEWCYHSRRTKKPLPPYEIMLFHHNVIHGRMGVPALSDMDDSMIHPLIMDDHVSAARHVHHIAVVSITFQFIFFDLQTTNTNDFSCLMMTMIPTQRRLRRHRHHHPVYVSATWVTRIVWPWWIGIMIPNRHSRRRTYCVVSLDWNPLICRIEIDWDPFRQ